MVAVKLNEKLLHTENHAKDHYFSVNNPILGPDHLIDVLHKDHAKFPLIAERGNGLKIDGNLGETGVVVLNDQGAIVASVKHPRHTPAKITSGEVTYDGLPQVEHIERSNEVPISEEEVKNAAGIIIDSLNRYGNLPTVSRHFGGFAAVGSEPEAWAIDSNTGDLQPISAGELQAGLVEETLPAIADVEAFALARAHQIIDRKERYPNATTIDTSTLITSNPQRVQLNDGHDKGPYVVALTKRLMDDFFTGSDLQAEEIMNQIAHVNDFKDHEEMMATFGNMAYWTNAASHASIGLPHMRFSNASHATSEMEAIAVTDIFNTNLATVAEMLMFSTPMIYGIVPTVTGHNNEPLHPRDVRAIVRYAMDTTNPGPPLLTPKTMRDNITYAIKNGLTHTMDRASILITMPDGRIVPSAHGRVRNRAATSEPSNQTGRVEFTGCPASPSVLDEIARNCFLQVLTVASYEALAAGKHPFNYFADQYPDLAQWSKQKDIAKKASLYGFHDAEVKALINESIKFLCDMRVKYPALTKETSIAQTRLENLLLPPVESLETYLINPRGSISEVIQQEIANGIDPLALAKKIEAYELGIASLIIEKKLQLPSQK